MKKPLDREEYRRWMDMARHTLLSAENDLRGGFYAWACFKAHQAAEYALKALLWGTGRPAYGHSLIKLASGLPSLESLHSDLAVLDKYYTAPRYADAWAEGSPYEYYTEEEAVDAIRRAKRVLEKVEETWRYLLGAGRSGGGG